MNALLGLVSLVSVGVGIFIGTSIRKKELIIPPNFGMDNLTAYAVTYYPEGNGYRAQFLKKEQDGTATVVLVQNITRD